jgi:hypothetical protein
MAKINAPKRLLILTFFLLFQLVSATAENAALFNTEADAQKHCPKDVVVWVNLPTSIYHFKGMRWYGNTNHGAYVCEKEGDQAGYRATRNGQ